jgi:hypothetical protein
MKTEKSISDIFLNVRLIERNEQEEVSKWGNRSLDRLSHLTDAIVRLFIGAGPYNLFIYTPNQGHNHLPGEYEGVSFYDFLNYLN